VRSRIRDHSTGHIKKHHYCIFINLINSDLHKKHHPTLITGHIGLRPTTPVTCVSSVVSSNTASATSVIPIIALVTAKNIYFSPIWTYQILQTQFRSPIWMYNYRIYISVSYIIFYGRMSFVAHGPAYNWAQTLRWVCRPIANYYSCSHVVNVVHPCLLWALVKCGLADRRTCNLRTKNIHQCHLLRDTFSWTCVDNKCRFCTDITQKTGSKWHVRVSQKVLSLCMLEYVRLKQEIWANVHETCESISLISYAGCLGLSSMVSAQFTLEMCISAWNHKKITKNPYFVVQGHYMLVPWKACQQCLLW